MSGLLSGKISWSSFAETIIELSYFCYLFLVTLVNVRTSVSCLILPCLPLYVKVWLKTISCRFMYCSLSVSGTLT